MVTAVPAAGRRAVAVRQEVRGTLEALTALRAGGWGGTPGADLVVARDGLGRLVIPGTSLAGALRAWLASVPGRDGQPLFDTAALDRVFGSLEHRGQGGEVCRIMVDDACAGTEPVVEIRDGAGIDRATASAAAGVLYQHEVVPPGTVFAVRITATQTAGDAERVGEALDLIVAALTAGRVEVGAARTRGLGSVRLTGAQRYRVDLRDRDQVLAWLCGRPAPATGSGAGAPPQARLGIEITWTPAGPVMVKASTVSEPDPALDRAVDTVPLRTTRPRPGGGSALLLPGSSIKGVLRSHAERITRTVLGVPALPSRWLDQVNDLALGPVTALFGTASGESGRRGALSARDCLGEPAAERVVTHVAVDRWTGGGAENLLFSVREPAAAVWEPIRLSVDVRRLASPGDEDGGRAVALLLLVLRDLADGWLTLGFGGTRGRGAISVSRISFTGAGLPGPWAGLAGRTLAGVIAEPPDGVREAFAAWNAAVPA